MLNHCPRPAIVSPLVFPLQLSVPAPPLPIGNSTCDDGCAVVPCAETDVRPTVNCGVAGSGVTVRLTWTVKDVGVALASVNVTVPVYGDPAAVRFAASEFG